MMDLYQAIKNRRSIRKYKPDSVPADKLERILEAARIAPSWSNLQCWRFIVVEDQDTKASPGGKYAG
jgi:nitroreductase